MRSVLELRWFIRNKNYSYVWISYDFFVWGGLGVTFLTFKVSMKIIFSEKGQKVLKKNLVDISLIKKS